MSVVELLIGCFLELLRFAALLRNKTCRGVATAFRPSLGMNFHCIGRLHRNVDWVGDIYDFLDLKAPINDKQ
jgi:hypothetical protein